MHISHKIRFLLHLNYVEAFRDSKMMDFYSDYREKVEKNANDEDSVFDRRFRRPLISLNAPETLFTAVRAYNEIRLDPILRFETVAVLVLERLGELMAQAN
ncbi:hypothetical protein TcasGA2_TC006576 [Tribolium castaneum]|uniref:Uncharacterized protein n=1 Tax=Tribolium castaneum TaxID=7070 RepID=D6WXN0_TRICA|nr:hypothetical protein TcasGA2_TC006576 [Tribolium castaneum]